MEPTFWTRSPEPVRWGWSAFRGVRRVVFVERDRGALLHLRKNIVALGIEERSVVLPIDAYRAIRHSALMNDGAGLIDLAFIDPPYAHTEPGPEYARLERMLAELAAKALTPDGLISLRHPTRVSIEPLIPPGFHNCAGTDLRLDADQLADARAGRLAPAKKVRLGATGKIGIRNCSIASRTPPERR